MLRPVTPNVHPKFDALYRDLRVNKLNANGTTKVDPKVQKERDVFEEELRKARIAAAKQELIKIYLQSLAYRGDQLPAELQELVAIIAAALQSPIPKDDAALLREDIENFKQNVKPVAKEIWKAALDDLATLARISDPQGHSDGDDLPVRIHKQKADILLSEDSIADARLQLAEGITDVHDSYRKAIETCIRILEQTIHGSVSRGTKAKADYLATVAEGMSKKLQVQHNQLLLQTNSPELEDALQSRSEDLDRENLAMRRKIRDAEDKLAEYHQAKALRGIQTRLEDRR
ncbi:Putative HAUS augmin-like complex subunit 4 [Septoria linicola]|uniref:HAUS augmin-like complex subunit 4 n=1 Tax=Septoria linicola TaxID=215465 RepID=A0A9Q9ALK5_9PEZI|nr:Putative HAUS augmin-like complex subunit 4 [Septoria linicola]